MTSENTSNHEERMHSVQFYFLKKGILFFFLLLFFITLLGLFFPLRPSESAVEKRDLTPFPIPTMTTFFNGEFTNQISIWFADTFPFRDTFIKLGFKIQDFYGISDEKLTSKAAVSDEIPRNGALLKATDFKTEDFIENKAAIDAEPEAIGSIYVADNVGFSLYGFDAQAVSDYVNLLNTTAESLKGNAQFYSLVVPTSVAISLSTEMQEKIGSSSQKDMLSFIKTNLSESVKWVPLYNTLRKHNAEYLFFRTDHHWTADAAYLSYESFMKVKGSNPSPLSDYTKVEYPGFIGSYYAYSNQNDSLREKPDTVIAYIPKVNDMFYIDRDGIEYPSNVICDASDYSEENKYLCFISGDMPYSRIDNPTITDGSSCLVIKESYGNAFVPFLVNNYQTVHVADYRYYGGNLISFIRENKIKDVILINNANALNSKAVGLMYQTLPPQ